MKMKVVDEHFDINNRNCDPNLRYRFDRIFLQIVEYRLGPISYYLLSESLSFSNFLRGGSPLVQKRIMSIAPNPDVKEKKAANFLPGGKM